MLPSTLRTVSASASYAFRGSIAYPTQSLCTLRRGRHLPQRNTCYQAGATPYLDRSSTGWTAPASPGAHVTQYNGPASCDYWSICAFPYELPSINVGEKSGQLRPYVRPVARRMPLAIMGVRFRVRHQSGQRAQGTTLDSVLPELP